MAGAPCAYRHAIYDTLPGAARVDETVVWQIGQPAIQQGREYLPWREFFPVRQTEGGLFLARVDTGAARILDELLFRTTVRRGERYTYTFFAPDTTTIYEICFAISPVRNGDRYLGALCAVTKVNGEEVKRGPAFLFRPVRYLEAIDRCPAPQFHFWALEE